MVDAKDTPRRGLTPKFIESLRPRAKAFEVTDQSAPGLRLRVHPSGIKSFRWIINSLARVISIGPWAMTTTPAHVTLSEARSWLDRLKAARAAGPDQLDLVAAELKAHLTPKPPAPPEARPEGITISDVAKDFLRVLDGRRKRPEVARYILEKDILPVVGTLPLKSIKKSDCRGVVAKVTKRGAKTHAGKVLGLLKQLLDFAENVEDDFVNPAARLKGANLEVENNVRDRWLTEEELPVFWKALEPHNSDRGPDSLQTRNALRLLLLLGTRSGELRLAKWPHVDTKAATWTIPVENQKLSPKHARQAKPFVIPLTETALALFEELRELGNGSEWVLASQGSEAGCYTEKALGRMMRRLWRRHADLKKLDEASPHDLRRTARTWLGKLGVPPHIAERCLNHRLGRIVATYDQGDYIRERRAALEKWDVFIQRLVNPEISNVTFLPVAEAAK